jgi:hypothetical protein
MTLRHSESQEWRSDDHDPFPGTPHSDSEQRKNLPRLGRGIRSLLDVGAPQINPQLRAPASRGLVFVSEPTSGDIGTSSMWLSVGL